MIRLFDKIVEECNDVDQLCYDEDDASCDDWEAEPRNSGPCPFELGAGHKEKRAE